ncbi:TPA: hypothetical protein U2Q68_003493 [Citrobacter amalonaticus]|nr:hypothetical protein [Citrobacter amalonaticus]
MSKPLSFIDNNLLSVRVDEICSSVPTFATKQAALKAGSMFGWRSAVRIERRFEKVWVVGKQCFQSDHSAGINFESYRFPLLRWDCECGVKKCPVLSVRRFKQEAAQ